jgi:hypothetical protein
MGTRIGSTPRNAPKPTSAAPLRSGDFVPALSKPLSAAEKKTWAAKADKAIAAQIAEGARYSQPDMKAVFAEEAGNLLAIRRALAGHPRWDEADTQKLADQVKSLCTDVMNGHIDQMRTLAASPKGPESIRDGESLAGSVKLDQDRLYRFGFDKPNVDIRSLDEAIKKAVVGATLGRRGWGPP